MSSSGLTWLQIINRVLSRLRENTVAANNTTLYSTFIGTLVNQVKSEIEDAYYWSALRSTFSVATTIGATNYTLTGAGSAAAIIDGWDITNGRPLVKGTNADFDAKFFGVGSSGVQTGSFIEQYLDAGFNAAYDLTVDIWPSPSAIINLKFNVYKPQADLTNDTDVALVPQTVLIEETIARALQERGDDAAQQPRQPGETFIRMDLLESAISRESGRDDDEMNWVVV